MASHPNIVRGKRVLEIGSGCGACGILAAKLGAEKVLLTDYVDAVLRNLRDCVHLNGGCTEQANGQTAAARCSAAEAGEERPEDWDPEDASECGSDDFDATLGEALGCGAGSTQQQQRQAAAWDAPPMHIRFYDWQDSVAQLSEQEQEELAGVAGVAEGVAAAAAPGATIDTASNHGGAPDMDAKEQFEVVIGTDVLYEW